MCTRTVAIFVDMNGICEYFEWIENVCYWPICGLDWMLNQEAHQFVLNTLFLWCH